MRESFESTAEHRRGDDNRMNRNGRALFFLLSRRQDTEALLVLGRDGYALPTYDKPVLPMVGFEEPAPYNEWFAKRFGILVFRRYAVDHEGSDFAVFVLESPASERPRPDGTTWVRAQDLLSIPWARVEYREFLRAWFADARTCATMPWAVAGGHDEALAWLDKTLKERRIERRGPVAQVKNAYVSSVFRCSTDVGDVYLKAVPRLFVRELDIMAKLAAWNIGELPKRLAADFERRFVLMRDMGGSDLSELLSPELLTSAVWRYAELQAASCSFIEANDPWPFYDMRLPAMAEAVEALVEDVPGLLAGSRYGLDGDEQRRLRERIPYWKGLCEDLQALGLPDALDHGDLRPCNIRIIGNRFIFYDWAWSSITHPFLSVVGLMGIGSVRSALAGEANGAKKLRDVYLEVWAAAAPRRDLLRAFDLADKLLVLYGAICDAEWLRAILRALPGQIPTDVHPDAWTLRWRQYYFAKMSRRLL